MPRVARTLVLTMRALFTTTGFDVWSFRDAPAGERTAAMASVLGRMSGSVSNDPVIGGTKDSARFPSLIKQSPGSTLIVADPAHA
jgi:hypothetical protein